jgi:hypothetical protein
LVGESPETVTVAGAPPLDLARGEFAVLVKEEMSDFSPECPMTRARQLA